MDMELCIVDNKSEREFREKLPSALYQKKPTVFLSKLLLLFALLGISVGAFLYFDLVAIKIAAILVLGILYAHMIELQHELLHGHAFSSKSLNDFIGVVMGIPTLSSYHGYKFTHLRHHRDLGRPANKEFFSYKHKSLNSLSGLLKSAFSLHRYKTVWQELVRAFMGQRSKDAVNDREAAAIRSDYFLIALTIILVIAFSVYFNSIILLYLWILPVLCIAEAVHFFIETPEHYGLNTQTNPNPLSNTRTISNVSAFAFWLTNGNNLHTAHHYHHGIPMCNIKDLHKLIAERIDPSCLDENYVSFYARVIGGRYRYNEDGSCMVEA